MHTCGPWANARCSFALGRLTSNRSGSVKTAGSRLARGDRDRHEVAGADRIGSTRRVAVDHRRRRLQPQGFLDRVHEQRGLGAHERKLIRARQQMPQRVGDHPLRRLDAAEQQHRGVRDGLLVADPARRTGEQGVAVGRAQHRLAQRSEPLGAQRGSSRPAVSSVTAPTIASYQPSTRSTPTACSPSACVTIAAASGPANPRRRSAPGSSASASRAASTSTSGVNRSSTAARRNGRANGSRWRACCAPSSVSIEGPTTRPVVNRGSSTVNAASSRITTSARSRSSTSHAPSAGTHATGPARSRSCASAACGSRSSSASEGRQCLVA